MTMYNSAAEKQRAYRERFRERIEQRLETHEERIARIQMTIQELERLISEWMTPIGVSEKEQHSHE